MKLLAIFSAMVLSASNQRTGRPMSQAEAQAKLEAAEIYASSSGSCTAKSNPKCTSYEGIMSGTVDGVIELKQECQCSITITGGTEVGHAPGRLSHGNGYKVNLRFNKQLDEFITTKFEHIEDRGDGSPQWRSPGGNTYAFEKTNWDVTYP